jgi:putative aldouronate transport system substrate-binding protein
MTFSLVGKQSAGRGIILKVLTIHPELKGVQKKVSKKRWLASTLSLIMVLALVLTACSGKKEAGNSNSGASGSSPTSNSSDSGGDSGGAAQDKVTFTMFVAVQGEKDVNTNETVIGKKLEEQTGVNFKIEHLVGDLQTKIGTMIASNDYPDVLVPDDGIENVIEAGGFIDLTPYIDNDKYPNIKKVYGPYKNLMKWDDGKIYIFPFSTVVGEFVPDPNIGQGAFWVQRRVLEWAGYPKIKTVDEYFKVLEDFINAHPDEDLIGFVTLTDDWRFFATTNVPNHLAGYPNDGEVMVDMQTHEAKIYAGTEWEYRWFKKLNEINAKGMFDKQSFVDNYDQYIAKLTSHKVLGFFDYGWQVGTANNALRDAALADPSLDGYRYFPLPVVFDENIKDQYIDPPGYVANRGFGITSSAKDPERIIAFIDTLLSEENQILVKWGIEGETYLRDENGRMYRTKEMVDKMTQKFNEDYGFTVFDWDWPHYGTNSTLSDGNAASPGLQPEVFQMTLTDADKKILSAYGVQTYAEMFADPDERPWYPAWGFAKDEPRQLFEQQKSDLQRNHIPKLVLSKPEEFDKAWDEYTKALGKLDVQGYEQWFTQKVKEVVANAQK